MGAYLARRLLMRPLLLLGIPAVSFALLNLTIIRRWALSSSMGNAPPKWASRPNAKKPAGISIACSKSLPCELRFPWISSQFSRVPGFIGWCRNDPRKPTVIRAEAGIQ